MGKAIICNAHVTGFLEPYYNINTPPKNCTSGKEGMKGTAKLGSGHSRFLI